MKALIPLVAVALLCTVPRVASATTRLVPSQYPTIQSALDASSYGDIVRVAPGTYIENLHLSILHNGVMLTSESGPDLTIIDGNHVDRVVEAVAVGPTTRIEGFTLTNGRAEPFTPDNIGGGVYLDGAHLTLLNNIICNNFAEAAGGLYLNFSSATLVGNRICDNEALGSGGGIYCDHYGSATIEHNVIHGNISGQYGGGITVWEGATPQISSNTIVGNSSTFGGGGLYITRNSHPEISRNIIALNSQGSGVTRGDTESTLAMTCNDVWGNLPQNYAGWPDQTNTGGNIAADPMFCDLADHDYQIADASPCAPGHSPAGCELIGAFDVGCGPVAIEPATWGRIKRRFR